MTHPGFSAVLTVDFVHTSVADVQNIIDGLHNAGYLLRMKNFPMDSAGAPLPNPDGVLCGRLVFARNVVSAPLESPPAQDKPARTPAKKAKKRR